MPMTNAAEYLERTAARVPDKVAFSDASGSLTFGQLLTRARALGTVLAGLPGCKNAPVAVLTGRTVQSVAALQGVLQSGNYYVPIDEQMPEARMRRILAQVHARAIVFPEACRPQAERLTDKRPILRVSAREGEGLDAVREYLRGFLRNPDELALTHERHMAVARQVLDKLRDARAGLASGGLIDLAAVDLHEALYLLGRITGDSVDEKLLDDIFSRFCVGK